MDTESTTARDLMSPRIVSVESFVPLVDAVRKMRDHSVHSLLILPDSPARGIGILASKDCIHVLVDAGPEALHTLQVADVMTLPAVTVPADLCIQDCVSLMRLSGVRTAPVVDGKDVLGVLSFTDILNAVVTPD